MAVLRENKDDIMTVLEVLIHDPLYNWSITPERAYRIQYGKEPTSDIKSKWNQGGQTSTDGTNKMAERVLLRVVQKLNGMEEGHFMSVQGQVNALIQQARDPNNLCRVFPGWQPYI